MFGRRESPAPTPARGFVIREAHRRDVPELVALWQQMMDYHSSFDRRFRFTGGVRREIERHLTESLRSRGARIIVAEAEGRVVGYILGEVHQRKPIYPVGVYGFVSDLSVTEAWRRRGVGRALVEEMLAWFRRQGVTAIELFVLEANPVSTAFWQAMGFGAYLRMLRMDLSPGAQDTP
jgi:GNAT superfamily N-acetyltransferase